MNNKRDLSLSDLTVILEGHAKLYIHKKDNKSIPSKSMAVFYNSKMEINRDVSNLAIMAYNCLYNKDPLIIVDSMAASGVSSIRMIKECNNIQKIYINDINPVAIDLIHRNLSLNHLDISSVKIQVSRKDANYLFSEIAHESHNDSLNNNQKPSVISIDPFGTPNLYIDNAFKAIQKESGLICITATDTAVLFGIKPNACIRKYMSKPLHTDYCKEIGARILIYFISRIANINKLGIVPLLTFYSSHFLRIFCLTFKNQKKISKYFKGYGYLIHCNSCGYRSVFHDNVLDLIDKCPICYSIENLEYAGPLWIKEIHDVNFINEILVLNRKFQYNNKERIDKLLNIAKEEIGMPVSYYNIHRLSKTLKLSSIPKLDSLIEFIRKKRYKISRTHFDFVSIKTNMDLNSIKKVLLELQ